MPRINPAYKNCKIEGPLHFDYTGISRRLKSCWNKLNASNFTDQSARQEIISMIKPAIDPYPANYVITSIRSINTLTNLEVKAKAKGYLDESDDIVQEMALHRLACSESIIDFNVISQIYGRIPKNFLNIYSAVREGQYRPNFSWLETIHNFTSELLVDITKKVNTEYPSVPIEKQKWVESALVAAAISESQTVFDQIYHIINQTSSELADRIREDRKTFMQKYAFHFTSEKLIKSIAEKGLSAQFAPKGSEQSEKLFFNNAHYAGVEYVTLGIFGFYVNDFLLRIPLDIASFEVGQRAPDQHLGDYTADYLLDKKHIIPPEKIEIVDPVIATRAVPLI